MIILIAVFLYSFVAIANYIKDNANKDPKEVVIDLAMKQIEMLFNLVYMTGKENDYENGLAFSVNDGKTFNKNIIDNYGEYFIKYGSKLYTLFPNTTFKRYASIVQFYIDRKK